MDHAHSQLQQIFSRKLFHCTLYTHYILFHLAFLVQMYDRSTLVFFFFFFLHLEKLELFLLIRFFLFVNFLNFKNKSSGSS